MSKFRVKLYEKHTAQSDQVKDGYLAFHGVIQEYSQREAIKKAFSFGGYPVEVSTKTETAKRAAVASRIVKKAYDKYDLEASAKDMIADLMHLCNREGWSFWDMAKKAQAHFEVERMGNTDA